MRKHVKSSHEKKTIYLLDGLKLLGDEKKQKNRVGHLRALPLISDNLRSHAREWLPFRRRRDFPCAACSIAFICAAHNFGPKLYVRPLLLFPYPVFMSQGNHGRSYIVGCGCSRTQKKNNNPLSFSNFYHVYLNIIYML